LPFRLANKKRAAQWPCSAIKGAASGEVPPASSAPHQRLVAVVKADLIKAAVKKIQVRKNPVRANNFRIGLNQDSRSLGIAVNWIELAPATSGLTPVDINASPAAGSLFHVPKQICPPLAMFGHSKT
jgi:hypothetical protein